MKFKKPVSVLVVIHTPALDILLLERAQHPGFWQSVTGSQEEGEPLLETARREVHEETGITAPLADFLDWEKTNQFEIFPEWQYRYGPGVTQNTEHVFSLKIPATRVITITPDEHRAYRWLPWQEAAAACFSWSNRDAILLLGECQSGAGAGASPSNSRKQAGQ
ncbi:MAG: dihydroneopterin triphosphate diphosphatase [Rugosibacter sp.]|jgi:dATP pyrophosphohydrolase|nr:dihydroneopterin triphosphate diphosphatase [Rugosibacter sp.]